MFYGAAYAYALRKRSFYILDRIGLLAHIDDNSYLLLAVSFSKRKSLLADVYSLRRAAHKRGERVARVIANFVVIEYRIGIFELFRNPVERVRFVYRADRRLGVIGFCIVPKHTYAQIGVRRSFLFRRRNR